MVLSMSTEVMPGLRTAYCTFTLNTTAEEKVDPIVHSSFIELGFHGGHGIIGGKNQIVYSMSGRSYLFNVTYTKTADYLIIEIRTATADAGRAKLAEIKEDFSRISGLILGKLADEKISATVKTKSYSKFPVGGRCLQVFMALLFVLVGFGIIYSGWGAFEQGHYDFDWSSSGSFEGIIGYSSDNFLTFDGQEARRVGTGLISLGAMLVIWGLATSTEGTESGLLRVLGTMSFACMLAAAGFIFPFWRQGCLPFYGVSVPALLFLLTGTAESVRRWGRVMVQLMFFVLLAAEFGGEHVIGATIACGMLATLLFFMHVLFLFPKLRNSLFP